MSRLWTRRHALLAGIGGTAAALTAGLTTTRPATAGGAPRRLAVIYSGNGTVRDAWLPTGAGNDFELSPILAPLEPHARDVIAIDGLTIHAGGAAVNPHHLGFGCLLTGVWLVDGQYLDNEGNYYGSHGGPTLDQVVAQALQPPTPYRSLELGIQAGKEYPSTSLSKLSAAGPGQLLPPNNDPFVVFDRVFGGGRSPAELQAVRSEKASVLDHALADLDGLTPTLSSEERYRIESHADALRTMERRLQAPLPTCEDVDPGTPFDVWANDHFPDVVALQLELLSLAFACDLTRIATVMFSEALSQTVYSWLGASNGHHDLSHAGDSDRTAESQLIAINTWVAEQVSTFATRLKELPDIDGSVYDNTVILWVNDLGKGNVHSLWDVPFVLLGGGQGTLRGGRVLRYAGRRHNDLLLSVCYAMGVERATFGDPEANQGVLRRVLNSAG